MRKIKHLKKAFREYNIRQRGLGKLEVSMDEYLVLDKKTSVDHSGKLNHRIKEGETHMLQIFGESILVERKQCIKCGHVKPLIDFICRYSTKRIEGICKECEKKRKRIKK